jgi:hypothetical protein
VSALRESALVLHGLSANDREWLLSRLPGERADDLRSLVDELQTLGLPSDPELTARALHASQGAAMPAVATPLRSTAVQVIAAATADQMHTLLDKEADSLLAIVASSSAWRWREKWFARVEPLRAQRVRKMMLEQSPTPALREAVLDAVALRLRDAQHAPAQATSAPQRARQWFSDRLEALPWRR